MPKEKTLSEKKKEFMLKWKKRKQEIAIERIQKIVDFTPEEKPELTFEQIKESKISRKYKEKHRQNAGRKTKRG